MNFTLHRKNNSMNCLGNNQNLYNCENSNNLLENIE